MLDQKPKKKVDDDDDDFDGPLDDLGFESYGDDDDDDDFESLDKIYLKHPGLAADAFLFYIPRQNLWWLLLK